MLNTVSIKAENGITFNVRRLNKGDKYGLDNCLTHEDERPVIEFYDSRYPFDRDVEGNVLGQFISRYYLETLLFGYPKGTPRKEDEGIDLMGYEPNWKIDGPALNSALNQLK